MDRRTGTFHHRNLLLLTGLLGCLAVAGSDSLHAMPFEDSLIFFPEKDSGAALALSERIYPAGPWVTRPENVFLTASDGVRLHTWLARPEPRPGAPVELPSPPLALIYFHGNAGKLADRLDVVLGFVELGLTVLAVEYRGYGLSEGRPTEKGIYRDAQAAWDHVTGPLGFSQDRVILFGKSLGGAPATELASRLKPGGLLLQSTFTSVPDMAREVFPFIPRFFVGTRMDNLSRMEKTGCPVLVIHSRADEIVPFWMGQKLYEAASGPKRLLEIPRVGHNSTVFAPGTGYTEAVRSFVAEIRARAAQRTP